MDEKLKEIQAYYQVLDGYFDNKVKTGRCNLSPLNKPRELNQYDQSLIDDVTALLRYETSHAIASETLRNAIALASELTLDLRKIQHDKAS